MAGNGRNDNFRGIISMIKAAVEIPANELKKLEDDDPDQRSLVVDTYTIGPKFFVPNHNVYGEKYKLLRAKSFINHTNIYMEILESKFRESLNIAFPGQVKHINEYYHNGNFVVECAFIIEVIRSYNEERDAEDKLILKVQRDLLVNDNQLPFSVLEALFNLAFPNNGYNADRNFLKLCVKFFTKYMLITEDSQASAIIDQLRASGSEIKDFIDLLRKCHAPVFPRQPPTDPNFIPIGKARSLEKCKISIRPSSIDTTVCSVRYSKGLLEIPKLKINNQSKHLLENFIKYEKQYYPHETFIIDYLYFMGNLIDKPKDVNRLIYNGILVNYLNKYKDVAHLFKNIKAPMDSHNYFYHGISEDVNAYCQIHRHRKKATIKCHCFGSPWMIVLIIAAIIPLVITLIHNVYPII